MAGVEDIVPATRLILLFPSPLFKTEVVEKIQTLLHVSRFRGKEVVEEYDSKRACMHTNGGPSRTMAFFGCVMPHSHLGEVNRKPPVDSHGSTEEKMFLCKCIQVANISNT